MSYNVTKTDGTIIATVEDESIDTDATSISLVGRNSASYGVAHSENFVKMLENFAFSTAPANPIKGQLWFDTTSDLLKVYNGTIWSGVSGTGGNTTGGTAAVYAVGIANPVTSVLVVIAGDEIVMAVSPKDVANGELPVDITVGATVIAFRSRFPSGLTAGTNLATDTDDFVYRGHVEVADQALYVGGGSPLAAVTYLDLGTKCVLFNISDDVVISAYSKTVITQGSLPANITVGGITVPISAAFPTGLGAGLTMASGYAIKDYALSSSVSQLSTDTTNALASATTTLQTWVDNDSATAAAITDVKAQFQTATGAASFSQAVNTLAVGATTATATASELTTLNSTFTSVTGESNVASAIQELWTQATSTTSVAGWSLTLDSNGYVTGVQTVNGGSSHNYFKVTTSDFIIGDNNIDFIPFEVRDGVVYMKNAAIENLTIGGEKITPNAITNIGSFTAAYNGYHYNPSSTTEQHVVGSNVSNPAQITVTVGDTSTKVVVTMHAIYYRDGGDDDNLDITVSRTDTTTSTTTYLTYYNNVQVASGRRPVAYQWIDTSVTSNRTYIYKLIQRKRGNDGMPYWDHVTIVGVCYKK